MDSKPKASVLKTKLNQRELFHVNLKVILIWRHRWYPISDNRTLRCSKSLYEALYWRVTLKHCSAAILSFQNFLLREHGWDRGASAHLPPLWPRFDSWIWCLLLVLVLAPRKKTTFQIPISPGNNGKEVPPWWNIFCIIYIIIITITQKAHSFVAGMLMLQYQPYINLQCP